MSESTMPGGWTTYSCDIQPGEREIFDTAFKGFVGVNYTPLTVATQVVAGVNYSFFCNAKGVYPNAPNQGAMVTIFKPLEGDPHITAIHMVNP